MHTPNWFDRRFDLGFGMDRWAAIYEQLKGAPQRLQLAVDALPEELLEKKPGGKWSIKEHAGHLSVMEPLWRIRFEDICAGRPEMTVADLNNAATTGGGFNAVGMEELIRRFSREREASLQLLDGIDAPDGEKTSLHPRLKQPMRVIDLAYFVAEHDDHHILKMTEMWR